MNMKRVMSQALCIYLSFDKKLLFQGLVFDVWAILLELLMTKKVIFFWKKVVSLFIPHFAQAIMH